MRLIHVVTGLSAFSAFECTYAYPGMKATVDSIRNVVQKSSSRQSSSKHALHGRTPQKGGAEAADPAEAPDAPEVDAPEPVDPNDDGSTPGVLIGDLANPPSSGLTPIGETVKRILLELESAQDTTSTYTIPGGLATSRCKADVCCKWAFVSNDLSVLFRGPTGRCNKYARAAVRLGFHDAATWEEGLDYGGADGSIILAKGEISRKDNGGLQDIVKILPRYASQYGVGMADLIQFAATHAVVCKSLLLALFPLTYRA